MNCDECGETAPTDFIDDSKRCGYFCTLCVPSGRALDPATSTTVLEDLNVHWDDMTRDGSTAVYAVIVSCDEQVIRTADSLALIGSDDLFRCARKRYTAGFPGRPRWFGLGEVADQIAWFQGLTRRAQQAIIAEDNSDWGVS